MHQQPFSGVEESGIVTGKVMGIQVYALVRTRSFLKEKKNGTSPAYDEGGKNNKKQGEFPPVKR